MPSEKVKQKALETLDNMREVIKRGHLRHEGYITEIVDESLHKQKAVCDGRNYCLLGTAWAAYGIKPKTNLWNDAMLPGVSEYERDEFLRNRPALKLVYNALNEAAIVRIRRDGKPWPYDECDEYGYTDFWTEHTESAAEAYFEDVLNEWNDERRERRAAYSLLDSARRIVEAA